MQNSDHRSRKRRARKRRQRNSTATLPPGLRVSNLISRAQHVSLLCLFRFYVPTISLIACRATSQLTRVKHDHEQILAELQEKVRTNSHSYAHVLASRIWNTMINFLDLDYIIASMPMRSVRYARRWQLRSRRARICCSQQNAVRIYKQRYVASNLATTRNIQPNQISPWR